MGKKKSEPSALEQVYELVDEVTDPTNMSKEQYRDFLGDLIDDLQGRLEAVVEELNGE